MTEQTLLYENLSFNTHPALVTEKYDGWLIRYSNGYTKRANSVSPLGESSIDLHHHRRPHGSHLYCLGSDLLSESHIMLDDQHRRFELKYQLFDLHSREDIDIIQRLVPDIQMCGSNKA